jgi:hypothetical protein
MLISDPHGISKKAIRLKIELRVEERAKEEKEDTAEKK